MEERGRLMRRAVDISDGLDVDGLMRAALRATEATYPHPNPRVGAVIVAPDGEVLATGVCHGDGRTHAETNALDQVSHPAGTTMVVTLEPCDHHGRTPPCSQALIDAGVSRVIIGATDPDPRVAGRGVARLRKAGIDVTVDVATDEVVENDPGYFHHRTTGRPLVTLKLASTLDGQVAALDGTSRWITGEAARMDAHRLRSEHDAVLVGAGTVISDDPALTVRGEDFMGRQPVPVVLVGDRGIPPGSKVLGREPIVYGADDSGLVPIAEVVKDLGTRGIVSVMVEGGPRVARSFLDASAADRIVWYIAARIAQGSGIPAIGGVFSTISDSTAVQIMGVTMVGDDIRVDARPLVVT
jgi:diaminohydroxyphosphoribosylaminopyrimidine deaminase/5-amino-6-(5-phosphoribosylamino)uracil reductase